MKCHYKGNSYTTGNSVRKPVCKQYGSKCVGETNCDFVKKQEEIIKRQRKQAK
ncbi:hypothetical protein LCGC14_1368720 [marine sediment metagenome]|uniref:Uncharacterized protein n=1 Tax=marine sediment metagenome TaxID=412755 RepID=A0A0F9K6E7_9ZZZZ